METNNALIKDEEAEDVDVHLYRSMIGSLMYLTASRPDIMFAICACVRFQVTQKTSHFNAVKRIFRYLKGQPKLGLWYPRYSPFDLEAFFDSDYVGASLDKKSTTGEVGEPRYLSLVVPLKKVGDEAVHKELGDRIERAATTASSLEAEQDSGSGLRYQDTILGDVDAQTRFETTSKQSNDPPLSRGYTLGSREDINAVRHQLMLPVQVPAAEGDFITSKEVGEDSDHLTDYNQIPIVDQQSTSSQSKKKQKSRRKQRKEAEVAQDETEHEESVPTPSNDPLPSGEDSMQLNDLMVLCTKLQKQFLDLEKSKFDQAIEIASLKKRVEKLERKRKFRTTRLQRLKKVGTARRVESSNDSLGAQEDASKRGRGIKDLDADAEMFVDVTTGEKEEQSTKIDDMKVTTAGVEDSVALTILVSSATTVEETLAQTLMEIKAAKPKSITTAANTSPKAKGIVLHDQEKKVSMSKPIVSVTQPSIKDKGKCIMQEPKRPLKKKDQVALDEQMARELEAQLQAELIEEERKERQKEEEANIALIESWENTQVMMEKRRKYFAALRAQEKRNRPPTKAQKRSQMSTNLKHMGGYKHNQLKGKSYEEIQKLFKKEMKRVNTFMAMSSEAQESNEKKVEGSEEKVKGSRKKILGRKRAGKEQQQESSKRQRMEDDKESDEDEEVEIDDEADLKKAFMIVEYKLLKEGIMVHYQLIRAYGSSKIYSSMIRMLQGIDKEYLQTLWKLVKIKHGDSRPEDEHERVLWGDLKVMFEPDIKSDVWRNLQGYKVTIWKLFDSCGVYFVRFGNIYSLGSTDVHKTFHVSNLTKCLYDESLVVPMKELRLDDKLNFVVEPVEIMDREVKQLRQSSIPIVKVRWNSKRGPEFTWERKDEIRAKYPHLFSKITLKSN
ncbi:hypothetical protein Tco_0184180 [Tanacetum coccineum]